MYISVPKDFSIDIIYKDSNFFNEDNPKLEVKAAEGIYKKPNYWKAVDEYYLQEVLNK
ncbi:hypothetical protein ACPWSR_11875 [Alloiococcus sp. CFN-8]|uniref:hypothetical protein n=1 Tax=Alloiococcus sp. CFN-8 TaxID=3416081 RepID=UPI003CEB6713